jgi:divalent metal cation (Fe/Co/Zn/Cd) transporter
VAIEQRALSVSKWANLFMAAAGILAAGLSNSQALLVDGLFSLIGFAAAIVGARVTAHAGLDPDARRPFGYAAEESAFTTFRALSLLALVVFAALAAAQSILSFFQYGDERVLNYTVITVYFAVIMVVCFGLAFVHRRSWVRTGRHSGILKLEADAARFDGILSAAAGVGLLAFPLLTGTALGFLVPVGDSVVVLVLCLVLVGEYWREFRKGLSELVGASARPSVLRQARQALSDAVAGEDGRIVDVALVKSGRVHDAIVFVDPGRPITASEVDALSHRLTEAMTRALGPSDVLVVISESGRAWPERPPG